MLYADELAGEQAIPAEGAIDEAVETAKRFCGADAPAFVNGILGAVLRRRGSKPKRRKSGVALPRRAATICYMRLLVVDDDRALRDVLRRALTLAGYEVRLAENGADALAEVASRGAGRGRARHRAARHRRARGLPAAAARGQPASRS